MKINKIIFGLILAVSLTACKDEKKEEQSEVPTEKAVEQDKNIFTVTLNATVKKDDSFQIYFKDTDGAPFDEKNSLFVEFKGSDTPQDIIFNLPKDVLPTFLRIDFGTNKTQSDIVINNFKINYLGKAFEVKGGGFFDYFYGNDLAKIDKAAGVITPILSKEGVYDPIFCSAEGLKNQIDLLIK